MIVGYPKCMLKDSSISFIKDLEFNLQFHYNIPYRISRIDTTHT
jgi:hypothetical protein